MASPLQRRLINREDGLGRIAAQLVRLKRRLNLLAAQQMAFSTLGLLLGAGGVLVIAAFFMSTIHFLALGLLLIVLLAVSLPVTIARSIRQFAALHRAASIADERANLNSRLITLLALAQNDGRYYLWPFLVEDTISHIADFEPNRIERRRVSRSIYGFAAACLVASLAGLMTYSARRHQEALRKVLKNLTLEVDPSDIAPFDSPSGQGAELEGDPNTLRSLAERLEAANRSNSNANRGAFNRLGQKAQNFASNLQDRLTGRDLGETPEKVKLRLAQALGDKPPQDNDSTQGDGSNGNNNGPGSPSGQSGIGGDNGSSPHAQNQPQQEANSDTGSAGPGNDMPPSDSPSSRSFEPGGPQAPGSGNSPMAGQQQGTSEEAGGSSAGEGSDPNHLMGPPDAPSHKSENFEIMIDARLSDKSPIASAQPYVPPKVKTDLNPYQHPDEPLDRGTVPAADRDTIRRVFER
jgi:hypothetical protein